MYFSALCHCNELLDTGYLCRKEVYLAVSFGVQGLPGVVQLREGLDCVTAWCVTVAKAVAQFGGKQQNIHLELGSEKKREKNRVP